MMRINYWQRDVYLSVPTGWNDVVISVFRNTLAVDWSHYNGVYYYSIAAPSHSNDSKGKGRRAKWEGIHHSSEQQTLCPVLPYNYNLLTELSITFLRGTQTQGKGRESVSID